MIRSTDSSYSPVSFSPSEKITNRTEHARDKAQFVNNNYADTVSISPEAKQAAKGIFPVKDTLTYTASGRWGAPTANPQTSTSSKLEDSGETSEFMATALQRILDKRIGVDREKLEELKAEMERIAKDESLTPEQKAEQLELVHEQVRELMEQAAERYSEQETTKYREEDSFTTKL